VSADAEFIAERDQRPSVEQQKPAKSAGYDITRRGREDEVTASKTLG
jgi:hypothetical protein